MPSNDYDASDEMANIDNTIATLNRFRSDESGQDIVEYALLGALVGIASILIWQALVVTVGNVYGAADANVQIRSSCTPDPISAGGGCS
jgi:Flp pilus assembly pilin Flp